ncbi:MAG: hypothetical protein Q8P18_19580 [Pseudomonadota bacterium]|nr:hypothetical protein [Pseudomonadota bacterium]
MLSLLALLLPACAPSEPELLLTGWNYEWETLSHRISYLRIGLKDDSSLELGLVGGDWSTGSTFTDVPYYRVRYQRVVGAGVQVVRGTATLQVGPEPDGSTTLVLDGMDLPPNATLVAVIDGFSIDTDVPQSDEYPPDYDAAFGYASNGFGLSLGDPERDGSDVRIPVAATIRWGPQDREDMNAAIPYAVTAVTVDVALIAFSGELEVLPVAGSRPYEFQERPFTDQPPMEIPAQFEGGAREGFVAWRSFDLQLNLEGVDAGQGDYLRAFGAEVVPTTTQAAEWAGLVTATLSTSSLSEFTDPTPAFTGELVRISAADVLAEHWAVSGHHPTGLAITGPTLTE